MIHECGFPWLRPAGTMRQMNASVPRWAALWLVAGCAVAACGRSEEGASTQVAAAPEPSQGGQTSAAAVSREQGPPPQAPDADRPPVVELKDAGTAPRRAIRYHLQADRAETAITILRMSVGMGLASGKPVLRPAPEVRMIMAIRPKGLTPEGNLRFAFELTGASVDPKDAAPEVVAAVRQQLAKSVGLHGWSVITDRGVMVDAGMETPPNASPALVQLVDSMRRSIRQLTIPFPVEPVGRGARWMVRQDLEINGIRLTQTSHYRLARLDPNGGRLELTFEQDAGEQILRTLAPGVAVELESMHSKGWGTLRFRTDRVVPTSSMSLESQSRTRVKTQNGSQPAVMQMTMELEVAPK